MACVECQAPSTYRFCSNPCFIAYAKSRPGIECQVCQWMPLTQSIGNHNARGLCAECRDDAAQADWGDASELEQATDDLDGLVAIAGGARIESIHGGRRKLDSDKAHEILRLAEDDAARVTRRRRRRSATGKILRGWMVVTRPPSEREIASMVGCSRAYVHKVIKGLLG